MIALYLIACNPETNAPAPEPVAVAAPEPEPVTAEPEPVAFAEPVVEAVPAVVADVAVEVQPGETLVDLAGWAGLNAEDLAALNELDVKAPIHAGQLLRIPSGTDFEVNRESALDARLARYFEAHEGLVGLTTRTVRTGDTAWAIAREEGLPLWIVAAYNRPLHLSALGIGDVLYLPVLGDQLEPLAEEGAPNPEIVEEPTEDQTSVVTE
ncbi:MAG: LysM peptidoglycan-binding domain-containing protein [Myxococcota bacterium]